MCFCLSCTCSFFAILLAFKLSTTPSWRQRRSPSKRGKQKHSNAAAEPATPGQPANDEHQTPEAASSTDGSKSNPDSLLAVDQTPKATTPPTSPTDEDQTPVDQTPKATSPPASPTNDSSNQPNADDDKLPLTQVCEGDDGKGSGNDSEDFDILTQPFHAPSNNSPNDQEEVVQKGNLVADNLYKLAAELKERSPEDLHPVCSYLHVNWARTCVCLKSLLVHTMHVYLCRMRRRPESATTSSPKSILSLQTD